MFTEIAFTPQIFEDSSNTDKDLWLESLHELGREVCPRNAAEPIIIADLFQGSCLNVALESIDTISDHRIQDRVKRICTQLKKYSAPRPEESNWPMDEDAWANEASQSHAREILGRILLSDNFFKTYIPPNGEPCFSISQTIEETSGFWNGIRSHGAVEMDIDVQIGLLRPICIHADYIAIRNPYIKGASDDETLFVAKLIASACDRPTGFSDLNKIELHLDGTTVVNHRRQNAKFSNVQHNIASILSDHLPSGTVIHFYFWPHFIERKLVAGFLKDEKVYPRWGIAFNHIARPNDNRPAEPWNIISQKELGDISVNVNDPSIIHQSKITI